MSLSFVPSAPTIICVLCPAGAKTGALRSFPASMPKRTWPMDFRMMSPRFSGARVMSVSSRGSSTLTETRSAYAPACAMSSGDAPAMSLR